jgi:hypothetical protein
MPLRDNFLVHHNSRVRDKSYFDDSRYTVSQFVLAKSHLRLTTSNFIFQLNTCGYSPYVSSSLTRGWACRLHLLLALASAVILRFESRGAHYHIFTVSDSRFPQPGGPDPPTYIPQEQGGTNPEFPFRQKYLV